MNIILERNDDYELVPEKRIEYLEHEVEKLRKGMPLLIEKDASTLLEAMNRLTKAIVNFTQILESAKDEIVKDYYDHSMAHRLHSIEEQNEKLARGMIAISKELQQNDKPAVSENSPVQSAPQKAVKNTAQIMDEDIPPPPSGI